MVLYHYTSKAAFDEIMRTKTLQRSKPWTAMDSFYGEGWYFTDLPPNTCNAWTIAYCWRSLSVYSRVESYLKFDIPEDIPSHCRDHVYMINLWDNRIKYLEGKETPKCPKGLCIICDVISNVKKFFGWT
jgi:hypothetical protein